MFDEVVDISLFSFTMVKPYEIYFSFVIMYGIVYAEKENAYKKRERMRSDLEEEYNNKESSDKFIDEFAKKYDVCVLRDIVFDED